VREFTLDEANQLIPTLHKLVGNQLRMQAELEIQVAELHALCGELPRELITRDGDSQQVRDHKESLSSLLSRIDEGWNEVQELGCVVKDQRTGLVDFAGRVNGELVWLCWRFGEESIQFFHAMDEGFSGRRPIVGATRHRLLN
jgi:hypothetical protein